MSSGEALCRGPGRGRGAAEGSYYDLAAALADAGMTSAQLGALTGRHVTTIWRWLQAPDRTPGYARVIVEQQAIIRRLLREKGRGVEALRDAASNSSPGQSLFRIMRIATADGGGAQARSR